MYKKYKATDPLDGGQNSECDLGNSKPAIDSSWEHRATVERLAAVRHPTVNTGQERNANVVGTF
ncbi:unnamed protein product [Tetraodon nigroviridis]|uniref:(spotted green pufferfish) hypothetical protein n=1 Tax=Tetraodon nigroviridis TaxID=99883 RepID=Q4RSF2_TETNG|nr:unnamed protein product [Tetraodon nigroviridis]